MCTCASCEYTGRYGTFAEWPRGEPAGKRASERAYSAHVSYSKQWGRDSSGRISEGAEVPDDLRRIVPEPRYPAWTRGNGPIQQAPKHVIDWINRKEASPVLPELARPPDPGKGEAHFHAPDRGRETAVIYDMRKEKAKRPVGRPAIPGRKVLVKLEEHHIARAKELGSGEVAAGVRKALESCAK